MQGSRIVAWGASLARRSRKSFLIQTVVVAGFYLALRPLFSPLLSKLPARVFVEPVITVGLARQWYALPVVLACSALPLLFFRRLSWRKLEAWRPLRWVAVGIAAAFLWEYSTYDYNLFFNQAHMVDRWLIIGLALLVIVHPSFAPPLVALATVMAGQFRHPLLAYTWTDKWLLFQVAILFVAFLHARVLVRAHTATFVFLALCLTADGYVASAVAKLELSPDPLAWVRDNDLRNLVVAAHLNGWLSWLDEARLLAALSTVKSLNVPLSAMTLALELGAVLLLVRRRLSIIVLAATCALHVAIYAASAILFWKWICVDLLLIAFLLRAERRVVARIFSWRTALASFAVIVASTWYLKPVGLGWFDTRLNHVFDLRAVGASGKSYRVSRDFMAPFDVIFAQNRFSYLTDERVVVNTFGTTRKVKVAQRIDAARTNADIKAIRQAFGRNQWHTKRTRYFDKFIKQFFAQLNRRRAKTMVPRWMAAPHHIQVSAVGPDVYALQEPVRSIEVWYKEAFYDGDTIRVLREAVVRTIPIPAAPTPTEAEAEEADDESDDEQAD